MVEPRIRVLGTPGLLLKSRGSKIQCATELHVSFRSDQWSLLGKVYTSHIYARKYDSLSDKYMYTRCIRVLSISRRIKLTQIYHFLGLDLAWPVTYLEI